MPREGQPIHPRVQLGRTPDECWLWLGPTTKEGHGKLTFCGRDMIARRWLWEQLFGPIPAGAIVYGTCQNKGCMNPHHLKCDWQAHANRDSVQTKLVAADVAEIRAIQTDQRNQASAEGCARRYGVSVNTVRDIWAGRSWARSRKNKGPRKANAA